MPDEGECHLKTMAVILLTVILSLQRSLYPVSAQMPAEELTAEESAAEENAAFHLYAQSAVLMDGDTGRILYGKEEFLQRPMASTTKIMTCILALENGDLNDVVTASATAASQPKVHLGVLSGETFYLKDLLYSLMLESHNDAAYMIAEHIGGSVLGFADMMNQKARDLGCEDTWFITPNGLDAKETDDTGTDRIHSTTAADLAKIMRYCVWDSPKKEEFLEITQTQNYYFSDTEGKRSFSCVNHNAFLQMMPGMLSGKTGFTGGAGYSYVGALEQDGRKFLVALLGCGWPPHKTYKWSDARTLFQYGLDMYHSQNVFRQQDLSPVMIINGVPDPKHPDEPVYAKTGLCMEKEEQELNVLLKEGEEVTISCKITEKMQAPVKEGTVAGTITYELDDQILKVYPVCLIENVSEITWKWSAEYLIKRFLII